MSKPIIIRVCGNTSCAKRGSASIMQKIEQTTGLVAGKKNQEYDLQNLLLLYILHHFYH